MEKKPDHPLRVGIILGRDEAAGWQAMALRMLVESGVGTLALRIRPREVSAPIRAESTLDSRAYRALNALFGRTEAGQPVSLRDLCSGVPVIDAETRTDSDGRLEILDRGVAEAGDAHLDVLLQLDEGLYTGRILETARRGLWRFQFGSFGGSAAKAAFWMLHHSRTEIAVTLEQQLDGHGLARVLRLGVLPVNPASYRQTLERVMLAGADFPLQVCRDLLLNNAPEFTDAPASSAGQDLSPSSLQVLKVIFRLAGAFLRRSLSFAFVLEGWTPGRLDGGLKHLFMGDTSSAVWVRPQRRSQLLADPVIVPGTDGRVVLAEALDYSEGIGRIVKITLPHGDDKLRVDLLLEEPGTHLSYPTLVRMGGALYCIPEAASSGRVRAYRLTDDTAGQVLEGTTLLSGVPAIDPTVFQFDGRWWLACTEAGFTQETTLWLYYAHSLFGPWAAHARNPVLVDVRSARPAGRPFEHEGITYRPSQNSSLGYGGSVVLRRIVELTPYRFAEQDVVSVRPDRAGPRPRGLHTVSVDGDTVVIDGSRGVLHPLAGWYRISAVRRAAGRARCR